MQCMEELRDVYQHFLLYYGTDIPKMKNAAKERRRRARLEGGDPEDQPEDDDDEPVDALKQATRKSSYTLCQTAGLGKEMYFYCKFVGKSIKNIMCNLD